MTQRWRKPKKKRTSMRGPGKPGDVSISTQELKGPGCEPSEQDIRWCVWGFLLAARAHNDGVEYGDDYLKALAEVHELPMPIMLDAGEVERSALQMIEEVSQ